MNVRTAFETPITRDLYYAVHKGIRLANARMLIALGQADPGDEAGLMEVLGRLSAHLEICLSHLTHENEKIHAVVESRVPGGADGPKIGIPTTSFPVRARQEAGA